MDYEDAGLKSVLSSIYSEITQGLKICFIHDFAHLNHTQSFYRAHMCPNNHCVKIAVNEIMLYMLRVSCRNCQKDGGKITSEIKMAIILILLTKPHRCLSRNYTQKTVVTSSV